MGVYRAVKIVYRKAFQDTRPFEREVSGIRSFEPISRLHEGFVDVLHVGINEEEGYFYYVMELGDDQASGQDIDPEQYSPRTLAKVISPKKGLPFRDCLKLGLALSDALSDLHKHGLVHRDVKPSNIIFVNGVPKLADIGLVAQVKEAHSFVGTEGFIPPEGPGTPQADIYSLGKVLYEASTGKDRQEFPELPTLWDKSPEHEGLRELNEVILRACMNEPGRRYQSASEMHADMVVLENGKSVRRLRLLERQLKTLKRVGASAFLIVAVLGAVLYQVYREWERAKDTRQRQVGASVAYGNQAVQSGDLLGALPYFVEALRVDGRTSERGVMHRLRFGSALAQCPKLTAIHSFGAEVDDGEFSPDDQTMIIARLCGKAEIYDFRSDELYSHPFGHQDGLFSAAFSPTGRFVATANQSGSVCIWDIASLEEVHHLPHPALVFSATFSPDGLRLVSSCMDKVARIWDVQTGQMVLMLKGHNDAVRFASFSPDGRHIVTTSYDKTVRLWNALDGRREGPALPHGSWVTCAAFSPDGQTLATACLDRKARLWEVATGKRILPDLNHGDGVQSVEFSPDGRLILTASLDGTARLWRANDLQPLGSNPILRHGERLTHACFSHDGRRILTTCTDGSVRIWDLAGSTVPVLPARFSVDQDGNRLMMVDSNSFQVKDSTSGKALSSRLGLGKPLERAQMNRNGHFVASISIPGAGLMETTRLLQVWEIAAGRTVGPGIMLSNSPTGILMSDDGRHLITFGDKLVQSWSTSTGTRLCPPLLHEAPVTSVGFSHDGDRIAVSSGAQVHVWDLASGRPVLAPLQHPAPAQYAEFSPDGSRLVTCCSDPLFTKCFAQVWDAGSGKPIGKKLQHGDGVLFVSFSPDGSRVVTASEDFTAVIWDAVTGRHVAPALRHEAQVQTAVFSADGKWILTASADKTARVWSAETGDPLTPPMRHTAALVSARFLADGRRIVTSNRRGDAWIWRLPVDNRPVEDLAKLGRLLGGETLTAHNELNSTPVASLEALWRGLRTAYPADFTTTTSEIAAWHEFEAQESELELQWSAATFHLKQLLAIRPQDLALRERLARASEHLKSGK